MKKGHAPQKKLYSVFLSHLLFFGVSSLGLALAMWLAFAMLLNMGLVYPASYETSAINQNQEALKKGILSEKELLPDTCTFGVYDRDGVYLYGNFKEKDQEDAWNKRSPGRTSAQIGFQSFYRYVERENQQVLAIRHSLCAQFVNPALRSWIPNVDLMFIVMFLAFFLALFLWSGQRFGRYMKKRLDRLTDTVEKIKAQDLEFNREASDILEIDQVLSALFSMKEALLKSLREQWDGEHRKNRQVAALAHDIKTPLTIIRGNAELIQEAAQDQEILEYNREILEYIKNIEGYLRILQETLLGEQKKLVKKPHSIKSLAEELSCMAQGFGRAEGLEIVVESHLSENEQNARLFVAREHFTRAVGNVLANGAEHSPKGGCLSLKMDMVFQNGRKFFRITVLDSGKGFDREALSHCTEQFYQGDKSRSEKGHYGLGLYIARTFLEGSGGWIFVGNDKDTGGGCVEMGIPLSEIQ